MGVHTYICRSSGKQWTAKKFDKEAGSEDTNTEASGPWELRKALRELALSSGDEGGVQTSFSLITPKSAIYQVIIGGAVGVGGAAPAAAAAPAAGGAAAAKEEAPAKPAEEEEEEEEMEFSLFD